MLSFHYLLRLQFNPSYSLEGSLEIPANTRVPVGGMYLKVAEQGKFLYISLIWKKLWQCGIALNGEVLQARNGSVLKFLVGCRGKNVVLL